MSKRFLVLRAGRVVYGPGHYDFDGAKATAKSELLAHPRATVTIVEIIKKLAKAKTNPPL